MNIEQYNYSDLKPMDQDARWAHKYCYDIIKGNIPSCQKMKWAAIRHFNDLERDDIYWDHDAAVSIVTWFKFCPIIKGSKAGSPTILDPSQIFIVSSLIAWKWSEDLFEIDEHTGTEMQVRFKGKRRYNQFFGLVARKYGKTTLIAGLKLYLMYKYKFGPRVFSLATQREQAKEVWNVAKKMIKLSPRLKSIFEPRANDILLPSTEGEFKALASDANSLDGLDPVAACLDECHAIKSRNLYGVLISAFGSNEGGEFLFSIITTAGFILDGLCTDIYKNGERVLNPDTDDIQDNYFYAIFEIDKGDDWEEETSWYKSNPALPYGRPSIKYLRDRCTEAKMSPAEKANFLTKHCNLFVNSSDIWLDYEKVLSCSKPIEFDDIKERECYIGVDRAVVSDITSAAVLFPDDDGGVTVIPFNLQSRGAFNEAGDHLRAIYLNAEHNGDLEIVEAETVRDAAVVELCKWLWDNLPNCHGVFYDPWHMTEVANTLEGLGVTTVSVSQSTGNMSEPSKKLEALIKDNLFRYNGDTLFSFACSCAMTTVSKEGNMKVHRAINSHRTDKIDPLIATIIALSGATLNEPDQFVYNKRGLTFI